MELVRRAVEEGVRLPRVDEDGVADGQSDGPMLDPHGGGASGYQVDLRDAGVKMGFVDASVGVSD